MGNAASQPRRYMLLATLCLCQSQLFSGFCFLATLGKKPALEAPGLEAPW